MAITPQTLRTFHDVYESHRKCQQVYGEFMDLVMDQSEDLLQPNLPHESITPQELWVIRNAFMIVIAEWRKSRESTERNVETMDAIAADLMLNADTVLMSAEEYAVLNGIVELTMKRFPNGIPPQEYDDDDEEDDEQTDLTERICDMVQDADTLPAIDTSRGATSPKPQDDVVAWSMAIVFAFALGIIVGMWLRSRV